MLIPVVTVSVRSLPSISSMIGVCRSLRQYHLSQEVRLGKKCRRCRCSPPEGIRRTCICRQKCGNEERVKITKAVST